jgi:DNA-directed RNA polymerase beta subunit
MTVGHVLECSAESRFMEGRRIKATAFVGEKRRRLEKPEKARLFPHRKEVFYEGQKEDIPEDVFVVLSVQ